MQWGSLCYDPLNEEILSIGGTSLEKNGTPGSWVFNCASNQWKKLALEGLTLPCPSSLYSGLAYDRERLPVGDPQ